MGIKQVYVIVNLNKYTKEYVVRELKLEGYGFDFHFGNAFESDEFIKSFDEVWCFGECQQFDNYKRAKELGLEIWVMG